RRTRAGTSVFTPDKKHLQHRLLAIGHSHRTSVLIMYLWAALFSGTVIWLSIVRTRSEEHTSELQSLTNLVCRLLLEKKNNLHPLRSFVYRARSPGHLPSFPTRRSSDLAPDPGRHVGVHPGQEAPAAPPAGHRPLAPDQRPDHVPVGGPVLGHGHLAVDRPDPAGGPGHCHRGRDSGPAAGDNAAAAALVAGHRGGRRGGCGTA